MQTTIGDLFWFTESSKQLPRITCAFSKYTTKNRIQIQFNILIVLYLNKIPLQTCKTTHKSIIYRSNIINYTYRNLQNVFFFFFWSTSQLFKAISKLVQSFIIFKLVFSDIYKHFCNTTPKHHELNNNKNKLR